MCAPQVEDLDGKGSIFARQKRFLGLIFLEFYAKADRH